MPSAGLFTVTRKWNQPFCPAVDEWIMNTLEFHSAIKEITTQLSEMDGIENIGLSEAELSLTNKQHNLPYADFSFNFPIYVKEGSRKLVRSP